MSNSYVFTADNQSTTSSMDVNASESDLDFDADATDTAVNKMKSIKLEMKSSPGQHQTTAIYSDEFEMSKASTSTSNHLTPQTSPQRDVRTVEKFDFEDGNIDDFEYTFEFKDKRAGEGHGTMRIGNRIATWTIKSSELRITSPSGGITGGYIKKVPQHLPLVMDEILRMVILTHRCFDFSLTELQRAQFNKSSFRAHAVRLMRWKGGPGKKWFCPVDVMYRRADWTLTDRNVFNCGPMNSIEAAIDHALEEHFGITMKCSNCSSDDEMTISQFKAHYNYYHQLSDWSKTDSSRMNKYHHYLESAFHLEECGGSRHVKSMTEKSAENA